MSASNLGPADYIVRGILIGGAVGAFGAMLGLTHSLFWGTGVGMVAGFLAGLTMIKRAEKRAEKAAQEKQN